MKCRKTHFLGKKSTALWQSCTQPISIICTILNSRSKWLSILNVSPESVKVQLNIYTKIVPKLTQKYSIFSVRKLTDWLANVAWDFTALQSKKILTLAVYFNIWPKIMSTNWDLRLHQLPVQVTIPQILDSKVCKFKSEEMFEHLRFYELPLVRQVRQVQVILRLAIFQFRLKNIWLIQCLIA